MIKLLLIPAVLAAIIFVVIKYQGREYARFRAAAKTVQATVAKKETRLIKPDQPSRTENYLTYHYKIDGVPYIDSQKVEYGDLWEAVAEGDDITLYYDPQKPEKNHPKALLDRRLGIAEKTGFK